MRARLTGLPLDVTPWYELSDFYNKTVALFAKQTKVVRLFIAVIIILSISNTMTMNISERIREIGTSMALGARRRRILVQFLIEGAVMGVAGGLLGCSLGVLAARLISAIGIPMPPPPGQTWGYSARLLVTPAIVLSSFALALVVALLASAYPAWKASRLHIVNALRHNG
jgi:putative ABC transport system permease protein